MSKVDAFWALFTVNRATYEQLIGTMESGGAGTAPSPAVMAGIEQLAFLSVDAQQGELDSIRLVSGVMVLPLAMFRAESGHDGQPITELGDAFPAAKAN